MTVTIKEVGGDTLVRYKSSVKVSVYIWLVLSKYTVAKGAGHQERSTGSQFMMNFGSMKTGPKKKTRPFGKKVLGKFVRKFSDRIF